MFVYIAAVRRFHENPACKECFLFSLQPVYQKLTATGISHHHFMLMCDSLTKGIFKNVFLFYFILKRKTFAQFFLILKKHQINFLFNNIGGGDTELIAMGGQVGFYRLLVQEGLTHGKCRKIDTSFKNGNILKQHFAEPDR